MLNWKRVTVLSNARVVVLTSIWVFIVPVLVKLVTILNSGLVTNEVGVVSLPLNFLFLYFSGLSFFLGALVYYLFCPGLIRDYKDFSHYRDQGGNHYLLESYISKLSEIDAVDLKRRLIENIGETDPREIDSKKVVFVNIGDAKLVFTFSPEFLCDVFWVIYDSFLMKKKFFIYLSFAFYFLGGCGLTYMFVTNLLVVLRSSF